MRLWIFGLFALFYGVLGVAGIAPSGFAAMMQGEAKAPPLTVTSYDADKRLWLHTSYQMFGGTQVPSNGLIVEGDDAVIVIDTGWSAQDTEDLLAWIGTNLKKPVAHLVVTHAHADKMSGVAAFAAAGAQIHAQTWTAEDAAGRGLPAIKATFETLETISIPGASVEAFWPGPGHTRDNIVVRVNGTDVLFGGCLIRPGESDGPGNTADADVAAWPETVRTVMARYPDARRVIPSHGAPGGRELLTHTIEIFEAS